MVLCDIVSGGFGHKYYPQCRTHLREADHVTEDGRRVCDLSEPSCDPFECCPREVEDNEDHIIRGED